MCYYCHTLCIHPGAPPHRGERCESPRNTHGKHQRLAACGKPLCQYGSACYRKNPAHLAKYDHSGGAQVAGGQVTAPTVPGTFCGQMRTVSGNHTIQPRDLDGRGSQIWDGSVWWRVCQVQRFGNIVRVSWVDGPMGTPEKFIDFAI